MFVAAAPMTAEAVTYNFDYTTVNGDVISGQLVGTLRADGDTIDATQMTQVAFNGTPGVVPGYLTSLSNFLNPSQPDNAVVSLSGSILDLLYCHTASCNSGFLLDTENYSIPFVNSSADYGSLFEELNPNNFEIEAVPLPASALLLLGGIAALYPLRRKTA